MTKWIGDDRVSDKWGTILNAAIRDRVITASDLTDGQRTMAEQQDRYNYYRRNGWPIAAYPSPSAPHIRKGRPDHALDVNAQNNAVYRLAAWLRRHGARVYWTVKGEPWHIEVPLDDLLRLYKKFSNPYGFLRDDEERWVREYLRLRSKKKNIKRRRVLRRTMRERRREIWRAANGRIPGAKPGWNTLNRKRRYALLYKLSS